MANGLRNAWLEVSCKAPSVFPWNAPSKVKNVWPPVSSRACFMAISTASDPEFPNVTQKSPSARRDNSAARLAASWLTDPCAWLHEEELKYRMASLVSSGWPCPNSSVPYPPTRSSTSISRPSSSK